MNVTLKLTSPASVRIVWMLTAAIFLGPGVGLVWWPASQTITGLKAQAKSLYDEANQNEADVRHADQLRSLAESISNDVHALSGQGSESAMTAATLSLLNREAHVFAVDVLSIVPAPSSAPVQASRASVDNRLQGVPIEVDVRARFRDVLAFVSDLPRHNVLIDLHDVNLADEGDRSATPVLRVKIHATIFRYRGTAEEEAQHASGTF